jgi:hypothetical protein
MVNIIRASMLIEMRFDATYPEVLTWNLYDGQHVFQKPLNSKPSLQGTIDTR